jgi:hypothetical protein
MSLVHGIGWIVGVSGMIGLTIGLTIVGVLLIIAASRKGSHTLKRKPKRIESFGSKMPLRGTLQTIITYAQQSGYKIEFLDETHGNLVLSDAPSLTSFGFFYPVYLTPNGEAETVVEVGIKSKVWQFGPVSPRHHERCFNGMKAAIL